MRQTIPMVGLAADLHHLFIGENDRSLMLAASMLMPGTIYTENYKRNQNIECIFFVTSDLMSELGPDWKPVITINEEKTLSHLIAKLLSSEKICLFITAVLFSNKRSTQGRSQRGRCVLNQI